MQRLSLARSLRIALVSLTLALALISGLGVASLYHSRQRYEDSLAASSELATGAATLATAAVILDVQRSAGGPGAAAALQAQRAFARAASVALGLARQDPVSLRLIREEIGATSAEGALRAASRVQARQLVRQRAAQRTARAASRRALVVIIAAIAVALLAALAFGALLIRSLREPLDSLVEATRRIAGGALAERVKPSGPLELQQLGSAFNAMGEDLQAATSRIEQERRRLATTIASLGDGLLVTEPGSSTIVQANPRAAELVPELTPGTAVDGPESPLRALSVLDGGEAQIDHRGRALAVTASSLGDGQSGTVWTVRDITERARLERAKSDFVATASHELRSPLTSIKGFVELLAAAPGELSERQREFVSIILRSTDRLVDLVNDLLDVARLEADHVEINRRSVDAGAVVTEVLELMEPRVRERHQSLRASIARSTPAVLADPGRLRQIVANLVTNAHLYTPDGGEITVTVTPEAENVRIAVTDTGRGMPQEQLDRVFERFYRATEDRASPGTGLGLSIVKSLVALHDGGIEVRSRPGAGTTFAVLLPAIRGATGGPGAIETLRGRHVLVVDDEREVAELIADQLAPFGVRTTVAGGGADALRHLTEQGFDAVTLDVRMPDLNGLEVLHRIRATPGLEQLPIVFVSASGDRDKLAGEWLVSKPIDADELRAVLSEAVRAGRSRALVVAREELAPRLEPALTALGVEHNWEVSGIAAARACTEHRFEIALVDVGLPNPQAVLQAISLRGRRDRRAVVLFTDGAAPIPPQIERLGLEVISIEQAAGRVRSVLAPEPAEPTARER